MNYLSLFSGVEAASVAWHDFGWTCVGVSEIDPFPCAVLKERFPTVPNLGSVVDITKEQLDEIKKEHGTIDIVVGGSPCQSFSVAGKRLGLEDPRGNLMFEYSRIVRTVRPKYFIWENVPGALSSNKGRDFSALIGEMVDIGYSLCWRVLDAQHFGVPQRRRRVFLLGCLGENNSAFDILFEREGSTRDLNSIRETRKDHPTQVEDRIGKHVDQEVTFLESSQPNATSGDVQVCSTLTASMGMGGGHVPMIVVESILIDMCVAPMVESKVRRLTPLECERLQGFPDNWTEISYRGKSKDKCPMSPRYKALGNSMAVPVMRFIGFGILEVENNEVKNEL